MTFHFAMEQLKACKVVRRIWEVRESLHMGVDELVRLSVSLLQKTYRVLVVGAGKW